MDSDFQTELNQKIDAGIPIIQIISYEWRRVLGFCVKVAKRKESLRVVFWWTKATSIEKWDENAEPKRLVPYAVDDEKRIDTIIEILKWYNENMPANSILVLENIHLFYNTMKEQGGNRWQW